MLENETQGVNDLEQHIPLDFWIRDLAIYTNTFIIGLLDCCRIRYR
jgi:hypothetical protein